MRRLLALLLLVLMPLQLAFAAAAPYCALEKIEAPAHFGHHAHPDAPTQAPDEGDDGGSLAEECGICHLASTQTPASEAGVVAPVQAAPVSTRPDERRAQHLQEPSEHPPRDSLA